MGYSEMHVERIQDGYQHCGQEEKVHLRVGLGARERTQVRIINRIDAEVGDEVGPCADERLPLREVQPMVCIKHGRRDEVRVIVRLTRGSERSPYHRTSQKMLQKKQSIIGSEMIHWYNMYDCFPLFVNYSAKILHFFALYNFFYILLTSFHSKFRFRYLRFRCVANPRGAWFRSPN